MDPVLAAVGPAGAELHLDGARRGDGLLHGEVDALPVPRVDRGVDVGDGSRGRAVAEPEHDRAARVPHHEPDPGSHSHNPSCAASSATASRACPASPTDGAGPAPVTSSGLRPLTLRTLGGTPGLFDRNGRTGARVSPRAVELPPQQGFRTRRFPPQGRGPPHRAAAPGEEHAALDDHGRLSRNLAPTHGPRRRPPPGRAPRRRAPDLPSRRRTSRGPAVRPPDPSTRRCSPLRSACRTTGPSSSVPGGAGRRPSQVPSGGPRLLPQGSRSGERTSGAPIARTAPSGTACSPRRNRDRSSRVRAVTGAVSRSTPGSRSSRVHRVPRHVPVAAARGTGTARWERRTSRTRTSRSRRRLVAVSGADRRTYRPAEAVTHQERWSPPEPVRTRVTAAPRASATRSSRRRPSSRHPPWQLALARVRFAASSAACSPG